jgi:WD40 repeat protein
VSSALLASLNAQAGAISSVAVSPDRSWLATASGDTLVRIWEPPGRLLRIQQPWINPAVTAHPRQTFPVSDLAEPTASYRVVYQ